ncbi:hypothetical protein LIER_36027 [Lithospermum erythrorhizon]|uniref:CCHC-type domain-containing protein n=1 Tax=Lithospermum erythrorhizon TaxID=34254 RepID=A0AAV3NZU2_LITER
MGRLGFDEVGKVQVLYRYKKICDVCLYCGLLGHEYCNCENKYNDEARKMLRDNKYDPWILVHGERHNHTRRREFHREPNMGRQEGKGESDSTTGRSYNRDRIELNEVSKEVVSTMGEVQKLMIDKVRKPLNNMERDLEDKGVKGTRGKLLKNWEGDGKVGCEVIGRLDFTTGYARGVQKLLFDPGNMRDVPIIRRWERKVKGRGGVRLLGNTTKQGEEIGGVGVAEKRRNIDMRTGFDDLGKDGRSRKTYCRHVGNNKTHRKIMIKKRGTVEADCVTRRRKSILLRVVNRWRDADVQIARSSDWFVEVRLNENGKKIWRCVFVYANCEDIIRKAQLVELCNFNSKENDD